MRRQGKLASEGLVADFAGKAFLRGVDRLRVTFETLGVDEVLGTDEATETEVERWRDAISVSDDVTSASYATPRTGRRP